MKKEAEEERQKEEEGQNEILSKAIEDYSEYLTNFNEDPNLNEEE